MLGSASSEPLRIRVAHFLPWLAGGGAEVGCRELIRSLPRDRYEQRIICLETKGRRREDFDELGIPVTVLGGPAHVRNALGLAKLVAELRTFRPHVLHASVFEGQVFGTLASLVARVPVVVTEEATCPAPPRGRSRTTRAVLRQLLLRNDAVVAIAPSVKRYLVEHNGIPAELVHVVPYGVREPRGVSDAELRQEREVLGIPADAIVLGTVCRLFDRHKRVSDLIRAVASLRDVEPRLRLLIVGDGPDRAMLAELVGQLGLDGRVHWAGYRTDPVPCFRLMDIFALTSALEGFGIVFVEAAWCGLPCVGTAVGGIVDAIEEGSTGFLVPPLDVPAIASAIQKLAADGGARQRMGAAGRERARTRHTVERYGASFDALFREALKEKGIRLEGSS